MNIRNLTIHKALPFILIIAGIIGFISASILMYDKIQLAQNSHYVPSCNLNPIIACGNVMQSKQGSAFGFPNPTIGIGAYAVITTIGFAMLAGGRFKRWFWLGLESGLFLAILFIHWLFFESVYRLHELCPFCMGIWAITITSFWYVTLFNIDEGHIILPKNIQQKIYPCVRKHHLDILILWLLIIATLILVHFWYYYGHYL